MRKYILFFFVIAVLGGCQKKQKNRSVTSIILGDYVDSICFDSIIKEYQYIELSQDKGFVLGEIDQVIIDDNRVYVSSDGVYCYDMEGNPLFKITNKGHARNEFTECTSISVNEGLIYLYDRQTKLIHIYNSKNGSFRDNILVPLVSRGIYKIDDKYVIDNPYPWDFYSGDARILITRDFSKPDEEYLVENQYHYMPRENQVTYCGKSVLFADYEGHSIFSFDKKGCKEYDIQCKDVEMIPQDILDKRGSQLIDDLDNSYTYGLSMVYENDTYMTGAYERGIPLKFVYNKKTNRSVSFLFYYSEKYRLSPYDIRGTYKDYLLASSLLMILTFLRKHMVLVLLYQSPIQNMKGKNYLWNIVLMGIPLLSFISSGISKTSVIKVSNHLSDSIHHETCLFFNTIAFIFSLWMQTK